MQRTHLVPSGPPSGGHVVAGTSILAATSAAVLALMSGCHSSPPSNAFAATAADKSSEERLKRPDSMAPLQPFDEHFVDVSGTD